MDQHGAVDTGTPLEPEVTGEAVAEPDGSGPPEVGVTHPASVVEFSPVRLSKFVMLSGATFGLYAVLWFYRNWRWYEANREPGTMPWARALFAPIWCYPLLKQIGFRGSTAAGVTAAYITLSLLYNLPGAWWLISLLAFVPLIPAVRAVNVRNAAAGGTVPSHDWRVRSGLLMVLGGAFTGLGIVGTLTPTPTVVAGDAMNPAHLAFLEETGILSDDEEIVYFYSAGLFGVDSEGVFASDLGLTSYWTDPVSEELTVAFVSWTDIVDVEVNYATGALDLTMVRIVGPDEGWFLFALPPDEGGDRLFLGEIQRRRDAVRPRAVTL